MVTLKDVARESGYDVSTVSRALSGAYGVHNTTRAEVLAVATRLDYRPNRIARGLATGRAGAIGLLISDLRNPYFVEVARGAEDAAYSAGLDLMVCHSNLDPDKQARYVRSLAENRVTGIIMNLVAPLSRKQQEDLVRHSIPVVLFNRVSRDLPFSTVLSDNVRGGYLAGRYLLQLGHRRIGILAGPRHHTNPEERCRGFLNAVREKCCDVAVFHGYHAQKQGLELTRKLLSDNPKITAIFAVNDTMAFGAIQAIMETGRAIPKDISLVGFDDVELSGIIHPPLTTVHVPQYEMGKAAVEIVLRQSKSRGPAIPEHRVFGVRLVERQSCRDVSAGVGSPQKTLPASSPAPDSDDGDVHPGL
jgi:LacI family transcriptional regulator